MPYRVRISIHKRPSRSSTNMGSLCLHAAAPRPCLALISRAIAVDHRLMLRRGAASRYKERHRKQPLAAREHDRFVKRGAIAYERRL
jgi:hypothetical protein